jgi:hypothetical protein
MITSLSRSAAAVGVCALRSRPRPAACSGSGGTTATPPTTPRRLASRAHRRQRRHVPSPDHRREPVRAEGQPGLQHQHAVTGPH